MIADIAQEHGCRLIQAGRDFRHRYHERRVDFEYSVAGQEHSLEDVPLAMRGAHQAANAAVALATLAELRHQGWCISIDAMRRGLALAKLAGRVEWLVGEPNVVLDTAHNAASAMALVATLAEIAPNGRRTLILSVSHDKDVPAIVRELVPHFDRVLATQYRENPRAVPVDDLAELVRAELVRAERAGKAGARLEVCPDALGGVGNGLSRRRAGRIGVCRRIVLSRRGVAALVLASRASRRRKRRASSTAKWRFSCRRTRVCFLRRAVRLRAACRTRAIPGRRPNLAG